MTIRSDVSVDWSKSPRLLTIAAPSTEITVQDIVDTCRHFEDLSPNSSRKKLIDAAGKEFLGGVTYVGITATLQNAVIAFEARGGAAWVLCTISGGNIVAVDAAGGVIDPRYPTAFVTVDRTASASATLQEQGAIQYASFGGGVTIDTIKGTSGTDYPIGTTESPVDNIADALLIADYRGFSTLFIKSSMTISGVDVSCYNVVGCSRRNMYLVIDSSTICDNFGVTRCDVSGVTDGNIRFSNCVVGDITNISGHMVDCSLHGTIVLAGGNNTEFINCNMHDYIDIPIIDMGGLGQNAFFSDWSGGIKFKNLTSASNIVGIQMDGGKVFLEPTISAGSVGIVGVGTCNDNSTGATVDTNGLLNTDAISDAVWNEDLTEHTTVNTAGKILKQIKSTVGAILGLIS